MHHTPKYGSRLNMAGIDLGVMGRQCLGDRIADKATLDEQVLARAQTRNDEKRRVDWPFTAADARVKLKRLYPSINK